MATDTVTKPTRVWRTKKLLHLNLRVAKREQGEHRHEAHEASDSPPRLLELPSELMVAIFSNLELADLCSLTRTNKALYQIITAPGSDIARHWAGFELDHIPKHIDSRPVDGQYWPYVRLQTTRWDNSANLAEAITSFIQYKTLLYHKAQRNLRLASVARRICERMTPLLFTLSSYLSHVKARVLDISDTKDPAIDIDAHIDILTAAMLQDIPSYQLKTLHYTWLLLLWLLNILISRPSYAGTIERRVRGWTADPLDHSSLARILVFGNLPAVNRLLQLRDYNERRKWAQAFIRSLDPQESVKWTDNWARLHVGMDRIPSEIEAKTVLAHNLHMQCLWTRGALVVFDELDGEDALDEDERRPSANNAVRLLAELAGYDILHNDPPANYDAEFEACSASSLRGGSLDRTWTASTDVSIP